MAGRGKEPSLVSSDTGAEPVNGSNEKRRQRNYVDWGSPPAGPRLRRAPAWKGDRSEAPGHHPGHPTASGGLPPSKPGLSLELMTFDECSHPAID